MGAVPKPKGRPLRPLLQRILETAAYSNQDYAEMAEVTRNYEGHMDTPETLAYRRKYKLRDTNVPLMGQTLNGVLGAEEKRRVDWVLKADDDDSEEVAEALNQDLNEVMRIHDAHHHCSEAYKAQIVAGLGFLYFGKNDDPFGNEYDLHFVPREEILMDRTGTQKDGDDCDWMARRRYIEEDQAISMFPAEEKLIREFVYSNPTHWDIVSGTVEQHTGLQSNNYASQLYLSNNEKKVAIYEVYYRAYEKHLIIEFEGNRVEQYNRNDPVHVSAKINKTAAVYTRRVRVMRCAWFIGPYLISDTLSPHPHNHFPFVRFLGYQEEESKHYFGLGRGMLAAQRTYNAASARIAHLLDSVRIIMDEDALPKGVTDIDLMVEAHRSDSLIKKKRNSELKIEHHWQEIQYLHQVKQEALQEIRMGSGISDSFIGNDVEQQSGVAIASLAEMSSTTLAEINANFQFARRMLGKLVLAHLKHKIGSGRHVVRLRSDTGDVRKEIIVNGRDEHGQLNNVLPRARLQVALADAETSEGYREQNMQQLMQIYEYSPDEVKLDLFSLIIKESSVPSRHEFLAELARKQGKGVTEDEQRRIVEDQQKAQEQEMDLVRREREAKIELDRAQAAKHRSDAKKSDVDAQMAQDQAVAGKLDEQQQAANDDYAEKMDLIAQLEQAVADNASAGVRRVA